MNRIAVLEGYESPFGSHRQPMRRRRRRPMREWVYTNPTETKKKKKWVGKWKMSNSKKAVKARAKLGKCARKCSRRRSGKYQPCFIKCMGGKRKKRK